MSKFTQKAIIESFWKLLEKKSLDKITVKDIIEEAQVNRNTFYYHFEDIYDLLDVIFKEETERFRNEKRQDSSFYDELLRAAGLFLNQRTAVMHIYNSKSRNVLYRYMKEAADCFITNSIRQHAEGKALSEEGVTYINNFYAYAITGKLIQWVADGMKSYDVDLMQMMSGSFEATVDIMIDDYISRHRN